MGIYRRDTPCLQPEAYYSVYLQRYVMEQQHVHPRCEIMYVLSGKSTVEVGEHRFELLHGQYIFLDEGVPHLLHIDDPRGCSIMNIEFACCAEGGMGSLRNAREHCENVRAFLRAAQPYFVADGRECFGAVMKDLIAQLERPPCSESRFLIGNLLERMICELAEGALHQRRSGSLLYVRRAVAYMEAHYTEPIQVPQIAAAAGVNRSYLQALFQKEMGCGVMSYVNRLRLSRAKFLLTNTNMRLADIACEVGFNSRQNFALAFQKQVGVSPSSFRKQTAPGFEIHTGSFKRFTL